MPGMMDTRTQISGGSLMDKLRLGGIRYVNASFRTADASKLATIDWILGVIAVVLVVLIFLM